MKAIAYGAAFVVLLLALVSPARASAIEPLITPVTGSVAVRYGETYIFAGSRSTHRGIDICGQEGDPVAAPCPGRVRFAGQVPADGGGRCGAVTIEAAGGALVTVMPLREIRVRTGADVESGESVGTLALAGDASSGLPHVHLSVRIGGRYVDPEPLLDLGCDAGGGAPVREGPAEASDPSQPGAVSSGSCVVVPETAMTSAADAGEVAADAAHLSPGTSALSGEDVGARAAGATRPAVDPGSVRDSIFRSIQAMQQTSAAARRGAPPLAAGRSGAGQTLDVAPPPSAPVTRSAALSIVAAVLSVTATTHARRKALAVQRTG
jgi:hypothetical protein